MFGRSVPAEILKEKGEPVRYLGARTIFHPTSGNRKASFEFVPDRGQSKCLDDLDPQPIIDWVNQVGIPQLKKNEWFQLLRSDSDKVVEIKDGMFTLHASPQSSYGYLYIGAWQYWPAGCLYEQKTPTDGAKWSSHYSLPSIGSIVHCSFNGKWIGTVKSYFVEHGWQGFEIEPQQSPAYWRKQNPHRKTACMFGADLTHILPGPA